MNKIVCLDDIKISNELPLTLIGGLNVIENEDLTIKTASYFNKICNKLKINLIFKASYDKANRSSINSYRGPGIDKGLEILSEVKHKFNLKIITDIHSVEDAVKASKVCDVIQLPAFLARQTDIIEAIAKTGKVVNIKKPQFMSPSQMFNLIEKFKYFGNNNLLICERGTCFGYDNLIVDMLGFGVMKKTCRNTPIIFDATHSLQQRSADDKTSGGRRSQIFDLAKAGVAIKIAGLFIESHPDPDKALCDGPSAIPLNKLEIFLKNVIELDKFVKNQEEILID